MTKPINADIQALHASYVREVAKAEFLTKALEGMLDSIPLVEDINLSGFVLAMQDALKGLNALNDALDQVGQKQG